MNKYNVISLTELSAHIFQYDRRWKLLLITRCITITIKCPEDVEIYTDELSSLFKNLPQLPLCFSNSSLVFSTFNAQEDKKQPRAPVQIIWQGFQLQRAHVKNKRDEWAMEREKPNRSESRKYSSHRYPSNQINSLVMLCVVYRQESFVFKWAIEPFYCLHSALYSFVAVYRIK